MAYNVPEDVKPQAGKQEKVFEIIARNEVDFVLMGGSRGGGKSELLTMVPLLFSDDPGFRGVFLRREYNELMGANGLYEKSRAMYPLFEGHYKSTDKIWTWPSQANQRFRHLQHEQNIESFRGQGFSFIGIDEIDQFSQKSVEFLMTCLRSEADMDSFIIGTLNPAKSWCLPLVEYYLDEDGFPDENKFGHIRHFVVKEGEWIFGPDEQYFIDNYPETVFVKFPNQKEPQYVRPKRFTFCFFSVLDNPALLEANPSYITELQNKAEHERMTQLYGNWYAEPAGDCFWKREWVRGEYGERVKKYRDIPADIHWYRGVDKGYSVKTDTNPYPDPTAISAKIGKDRDGHYWIVGDYAPTTLDDKQRQEKENSRIYGQFVKLAGERDGLLVKQLKHDGEDTSIVLSKDTGAGTTDHTFTKALMVEEGIHVVEDKSAKNTPDKKIRDFLPFCNACEVGLVFIVEESFNTGTLNFIYNQLEKFDGSRSSSTKKDDQVDAHASAFNAAASQQTIPTFTLGAIGSTPISRKSQVMGEAAPIFGRNI